MTRTYSKVYRNERKSYRTQIFIALAVILVGGLFTGLYFFLRSDTFRVTAFTVDGQKTFTADEVKEALVADISARCSTCTFFGPDSMLFWHEGTAQDVPGLFPYVESASVSRSLFSRSVAVQVTEREKRMVWCLVEGEGGGRTCYWMDPKGRALGEAPYMEGKAIVLAEERTVRTIEPGGQILSETEARNFTTALGLLENLGISTTAVVIDTMEQKEFSVMTSEGPVVRFSFLFDPAPLVSGFKDLRAAGGWQELRVVDARVENRLYYK